VPINDDEVADLLNDVPVFAVTQPVLPAISQVLPVVPPPPPVNLLPQQDEEEDDSDEDIIGDEVLEEDDEVFEDADEIDNVIVPTEMPGNKQTYNLREKGDVNGGFNDAMDNPYDGRSYYAPTQLTQIDENMKKHLFGFVMTQMTAKAGLKKFGKAAEIALLQEFGQLEDQNVYKPIDLKTLTQEQRKGALRVINLIAEKRDGKIKGRTVADGSPQRTLYEKHETASPILSTDALLLLIMADAYERRDVATADIAGAYLSAYMKDFVEMKFTGDTVDMLCELNPSYKAFVVIENGVKVLYVRLVKALYGCVKSALLR
jgi:hypothetical protein